MQQGQELQYAYCNQYCSWLRSQRGRHCNFTFIFTHCWWTPTTFITSRVTALLHNSVVQPVAALKRGVGGHGAPSFLLNFPFKFLWLTWTADKFQPANFKRFEDLLATFWRYSQAYVRFDKVNHSQSLFITTENLHAGEIFMLTPYFFPLTRGFPPVFHSRIATTFNYRPAGRNVARNSAFSGSRKRSEKIFKSEICWNTCEFTFASLNCLRWIKWIYTTAIFFLCIICFIYLICD